MNTPISFLTLACLVLVLNGHGKTSILVAAKSNVHIVYLGEKKHDDPKLVTESHHDLLASIVGTKEKASELIVYSYKHGFSGFAAKLTEFQAQRISELDGVVRVIPNTIYKLKTTRSWDSLGLTSQPQSNNLLQNSKGGDDVIIGIFDTGIWPESKSFDDKDIGPIPSRWKGICEGGEQFNNTNCNRKIIGARWFIDGFLPEYGVNPLNTSGNTEFLSARDANGHGTHTTSTAAGVFVGNISYNGLANGTVRGGAPNARVAVYKVCWNLLGAGLCSSADILMGFDMAIHDGVDVLSLSLATPVPLFSEVDKRDGVATGAFHAVAKGITVVCAAGNSGPFDQTVENVAPWILTVGASGIDRSFQSSITLGNNQTFMGESLYTGKEIGFTGLVYPESDDPNSFTSGRCEILTLKNDTTGKVVLCFSFSIGRFIFEDAASAVKDEGGVGLIIAMPQSGNLSPCSDNFPCIHVDFELGTRILFYIRSTSDPLVKLSSSRTIVGKPASSKMAIFSSRGPNSIAPAILKPDIAAPGVNILAATSPLAETVDNGYAIFSGTSMATPHVAGIVVLLRAIHPSWSPAAIRSALVTTASTRGPLGQPIFAEGAPIKLADPFDFGGGIANPNSAANPGLVYDMGVQDYVYYLCAMRYNNSAISHLIGNTTNCPSITPSTLNINLPSITVPSIWKTPITVTRTVTNVGPSNSIYRAVIESPSGISVLVRPEVLVFNSSTDKISFQVTISSTYEVETGYLFGSLTWTDRVHVVRIPLSVRTQMFQSFGVVY